MLPQRCIIPVTFSRSKVSPQEKSIYQASLAWALKEDYESLADDCDSFLHPNELAYFRTLTFERRQRSYLLGRYAAKQALMQTGYAYPAQVEIAAGVFNQPIVKPGQPEPISISLSHSEHLACALAFPEAHPIAIDVEDTIPDRSDVMKTQILPRELDQAASAWGNTLHHSVMIWTAKEALSKALRCGMTCPFELLAVKELEVGQGFFGGQFENFAQYRFQTWIIGGTVMSIVFPRNSAMMIDMESMIEAMARRQVPALI